MLGLLEIINFTQIICVINYFLYNESLREQILQASNPQKATVQLHAPYLTNHPSKMNKTTSGVKKNS